MEKEKQNWLSNVLAGVMPTSEETNINYKFDPFDNSIMKISWNSPNDGKKNLVNVLLSAEPYTIRIKDNH